MTTVVEGAEQPLAGVTKHDQRARTTLLLEAGSACGGLERVMAGDVARHGGGTHLFTHKWAFWSEQAVVRGLTQTRQVQ